MSVLVFTENWDGKFKKLSFELVSYASKIAALSGSAVTAVSIGDVDNEELKKLGDYGAGTILKVSGDNYAVLDNQVYTKAISEAVKKSDAKVVVLSHNNTGKAIAPRLSVKLKAGLAPGVTALPESMDPFIVSKKVFTGKAISKIKVLSESVVLTLAQNSFELIEAPNHAVIEDFHPDLGSLEAKTSVRDTQKQEGKIILTDADVVISGGRGLKSPDNWAPVEELAELLDGATACSRPVSDEGWRPHEEHTGQTGKVIAPNLYMAFGISGAIQHLAGVSSSKYIVAVNTDKDAPIFEAADYGVVGDALKVLPELIAEIRSARS